MTPQDYNTLATALQERGYHKYKGYRGMGHYYWCKSFGYAETSYGEQEPEYTVIFKIYDYTYNPCVEERDRFGYTPSVLVSRNRRLDLDFTAYEHLSVEEIEQKAQSFYEWAKQNLEI